MYFGVVPRGNEIPIYSSFFPPKRLELPTERVISMKEKIAILSIDPFSIRHILHLFSFVYEK